MVLSSFLFFLFFFLESCLLTNDCCTKIVDPKTGEEKPVTISVDDGIRPDTSIAGLSKLKPAFKKDGTTTAGIITHICHSGS